MSSFHNPSFSQVFSDGCFCCVSFSSEYINLSSLAGKDGKQVGRSASSKTNELASLHPFQSP